MKISFVALDFKPNVGGVAEFTHQMAKSLHKAGESVTVISKRLEEDQQFDSSVDYSVRRLKSDQIHQDKNLTGYFKEYKVFSRTFDDLNPDVIVYNALGPNAEYRLGLFYSKLHSVPFGTFTYGREINRKTDIISNAKQYFSLNLADFVIPISSSTDRITREYPISNEQLKVINPGLDCDEWDRRLDQVKEPPDFLIENEILDRPLILSLGRLTPRKGFDQVINALSEVLKEVPDAVLVVAGQGDDHERLKSLVEKHQLHDHVYFPGYVREKEKVGYYREADVFAMPCRETADGDIEGFGIVFLESQICGTPVVGGDQGGARDAMIPGETGFLVDPDDTNELAGSLKQLLTDKKLRERMTDRAQQFVREEMHWKFKGKEFRDFLQSLVEKR
ncbi:MAG: glycosyltransferase family 4 protein [bacterium]